MPGHGYPAEMRIGSLRGVPTDLLADLIQIGRAISRSRAARVYRAHPVGWRIVGYLIAGAIIAVLIILDMTPPSA
jgi:hypothetical protein